MTHQVEPQSIHMGALPTKTQWTAIRAHDREFDGAFIYGVTSSKIYCKPSCPSRDPNHANVRIFPDTAAASKAGFRACKRCKPSDEG